MAENPGTGDVACVFCEKIRAGDVFDASKDVVWFVPLNPVVAGHMLFVSRIHLRDASDVPRMTAEVMYQASLYAEMGDDFNLITSGGRHATQSVFHLHIHYVPRFEADGLHLPWTGQHD